jgi:hypothetical protein
MKNKEHIFDQQGHQAQDEPPLLMRCMLRAFVPFWVAFPPVLRVRRRRNPPL